MDCINFEPDAFYPPAIGWCKIECKPRGLTFFCAYAIRKKIDNQRCKKIFPDRLVEIRRSKGLTQRELAELLDVTRTTVVYWETGRVYPRASMLQEIVKTLEVSLNWLTGVEG